MIIILYNQEIKVQNFVNVSTKYKICEKTRWYFGVLNYV